MRHMLLFTLFVSMCAAHASVTPSSALTGVVLDSQGVGLSGATVYVYSARLKHGISTVCPSCWLDCGKSARSDVSGRFIIMDLDPKLKFRLLVVRGHYVPAEIQDADLQSGEPQSITLSLRPQNVDPARHVVGRLIDRNGNGVAGALLEPTEAIASEGTFYVGEAPGVEKLEVSDENGNFEISSEQPYQKLGFVASARGFAPTFIVKSTGDQIRNVTLTSGVTVIGRLVRAGGYPVAHVEVEMSPFLSANGAEVPPIRVGTDAKGVFTFSNVPADRVFRIYPTDSLQSLNLAGAPLWFETKDDGDVIHVRDYILRPGISLSGRVEIPKGAPIPQNLYVSLQDGNAGGTNVTAPVDLQGNFRFAALAPGPYALQVMGMTLVPSAPRQIFLAKDRSDIQLSLPSR